MRKKRLILDRSECKPVNYKFLTMTLLDNEVLPAESSVISHMEKVFLRSLLVSSPAEILLPLSRVRLFEGSFRRFITFYCSEIAGRKNWSFQLLSLCRVKYN